MDFLFNVLNYFASLSDRHGADPLEDEWRAIQLRLWVSGALVLVVFGASVWAANTLEAWSAVPLLAWLADGAREPVAFAAIGGYSLAVLFFLSSVWSLWRFLRKNGAA